MKHTFHLCAHNQPTSSFYTNCNKLMAKPKLVSSIYLKKMH